MRPVIMLVLAVIVLMSCEEEEYSGPITVDRAILVDLNAEIQEREVSFARLGQLIRLEGSGFQDLRKLYINGHATYFNVSLATDNIVYVTLSSEIPTAEADPNERNSIRLVNDGGATRFELEIRAAVPVISRISNTLPLAGEQVTVYGIGLVEIQKITLPGGVVVTDVASDPDGAFCTFTMPEGVTESGDILLESPNGGAYSPAFFNARNGLILDFDGNGVQGSWDREPSMLHPEDLESAPIGLQPVSKGTYVAHRPQRMDTLPGNKNRATEVWTSGGMDWRATFTSEIPAVTPVSEVGFQFDIYVPERWSGSGYLKICLINNFQGGEWDGPAYNYIPWIQNGQVQSFRTEGWQTVTIPFSEFFAFSDAEASFTFEDVLAAREAATYQNFGFYFENGNFTLDEVEYPASATDVQVYTDNWRLVSLATQTYSDFE